MPKKPLKIIGINPGTRYLGVALFCDSELRDWGVKVLSGKWSKSKMDKIKKIVLRYINLYEPEVLAIKKLHPSRRSKNLVKLVRSIKDFTKRKGLRIYQYSIKDIEQFFLTQEKANKKKLFKKISSEYQDLFHEYKREKDNKNSYYIRMVEAVALASLCFHKLDKS